MNYTKSLTIQVLLVMFLLSNFACSTFVKNETITRQSEFDYETILTDSSPVKFNNNIAVSLINNSEIAITEINFPVLGSNDISKIDITSLRPETNTIPNINSDQIYQIIRISIDRNIDKPQIPWVNIKFGISSNWLNENGFSQNDIHIFQNNQTWNIFKVTTTEKPSKEIIAEVTLPSLSTFAVLPIKNPVFFFSFDAISLIFLTLSVASGQ